MDPQAGPVPMTYPAHDPTSWIISHRPVRAGVNPFEPNGFFLEQELSASGRIVDSGGILLTNKECPWRCLMCDLWKHTLPYTVPLGAIPRQIDYALAAFGSQPAQLKLYNSGSFFDAAAIPLADYQSIAERISFADHVIVESHPRLIGEKTLRLRDLLHGSLEVAMGLETVHPRVLPRLNKRVSLEQFAQATAFLRRHEIEVRAFVLVNPPFLRKEASVEWAVESARFAFSCGVGVVSLIPTRAGNGALDQLIRTGDFTLPSLSLLEQSLDLSVQLRGGRVFADTWDLERFSSCPACFGLRRQRLASINLTQAAVPPVHCSSCGSGLN
jgi:radical SAM enzyme (TIGR01210 family)